jgi:hypothetical protein
MTTYRLLIFLTALFIVLLAFKAFRVYNNVGTLKVECRQQGGEVIKYNGNQICAKIEILQGIK